MLKKPNYKAWSVKEEDFPASGTLSERLKFLLNFAVLAPSSHNSQPWKFKIKEGIIYIYCAEERKLPYGDPEESLLNIAIGAATENILIAADYFGMENEFVLSPEDDPKALAKLVFSEKGTDKKSGENHLLGTISRRHTNRGVYRLDLPDDNFIDNLAALSDEKMRIEIVSDRKVINNLVNVAAIGVDHAMKRKEFRKELAKYKKNNLTRSYFGMPCSDMGYSLVFSFILPLIIKFFPIAPLIKKKDGTLLRKHTPMVVVISTKNDTKHDQIRSGMKMCEIMLRAEQAGLATHFMAAPVFSGEQYKDVQKVLNTDFHPQVFFRMGFPVKQMPYSPRLPAEKCII